MDDFPTLEFGPIEHHAGEVFRGTLDKGIELFLNDGALLVKKAFSPDHINKPYEEYVGRYADYFEEKDFEDAETVGNKRTMFSVSLEGQFNDPEVYANPLLLPLISRLLNDRAILESFGSVVSLPGAEQQRVHRDMFHLFEPMEGKKDCLSLIPPYAITVMIPLEVSC